MEFRKVILISLVVVIGYEIGRALYNLVL